MNQALLLQSRDHSSQDSCRVGKNRNRWNQEIQKSSLNSLVAPDVPVFVCLSMSPRSRHFPWFPILYRRVPSQITRLHLTRYICLFSMGCDLQSQYGLLSLLLNWPELLSSRQSPQTVTQDVIEYNSKVRDSIHFHTRLVPREAALIIMLYFISFIPDTLLFEGK